MNDDFSDVGPVPKNQPGVLWLFRVRVRVRFRVRVRVRIYLVYSAVCGTKLGVVGLAVVAIAHTISSTRVEC